MGEEERSGGCRWRDIARSVSYVGVGREGCGCMRKWLSNCRGGCDIGIFGLVSLLVVGYVRLFTDDFCGSGLLLVSVPDFGNPELVTMGVSIEKPATGILKLATSLEFGEAEPEDEYQEEGTSSKGNATLSGGEHIV